MDVEDTIYELALIVVGIASGIGDLHQEIAAATAKEVIRTRPRASLR